MEYDDLNLKDYDDYWKGIEVKERESKEVPDGTYLAEISALRPKFSKNGYPMFSWEFTVLGPSHKNRKVFRNDVINDDRLKFIKQDFYTIGLNLENLSDFEDRAHEVIGRWVEIKIASKEANGQTYHNIYINKRVAGPDDGTPF